jgi:hypothetical protein
MDTPFWVNSYLAHRSLSKSHISPQIQHLSKGPVHWPKNVVQGIFLPNSVSRFADDHCKLWDMRQTGIKNSDLKDLGIQVQQWINMKDGAHLLHSPRAQTIHVDTWLQLQGQWQIAVLLWIWSCAAFRKQKVSEQADKNQAYIPDADQSLIAPLFRGQTDQTVIKLF